MKDIIKIIKDNFSLEKKYIILYLILFSITQLGLIQIPSFIGKMISVIENKGSYNELWNIFLVACGVVLIFDALDNIVGAIKIRFHENLLIKNRLKYRQNIQNKDFAKISDIGSGKLMQKFNQGISAEVDIFVSVLGIFVVTLIRGFWIIGIFVIYAPVMLIPLSLGAITSIWLGIYFGKKTDDTTKITDDIAEENSKSNVRFFQEFGLIKVNNKFDYENTILHKLLSSLPGLEIKKYMYGEMPYKMMYYLIQCGEFFLYLYLGNMVIGGTYSLATLVMLATYIWWLRRPIDSFMQNYNQIQRNISKYKSLQTFLSIPNTITDGVDIYRHSQGAISLRDVDFSYNSEKHIFQKFSHNFLPKKTTALVGHSGSGKSTLIKLILRLYKIDSGYISIDDQDIYDTQISSVYDQIGYLTQEPGIFDGSIRENLAYAIGSDIDIYDPSIESQMIEALRKASIYDLVSGLEKGLDTELGEKGIKLSGGERQRLAIARIFLKNPKILILDEPTSALDSISEHAITQVMKTLFVDRTVIVIAHRLQTVMHADQILVMDHGHIVEVGDHTQLLEQGGVYASLVDLQSGLIKE